MIPIEATLYHNTGIDAATTGAANNNLTHPIEATAIDLAMTHHIFHIADHPHIEAFQVIDPEITVGHIQVHNPAAQSENHIPRRT